MTSDEQATTDTRIAGQYADFALTGAVLCFLAGCALFVDDQVLLRNGSERWQTVQRVLLLQLAATHKSTVAPTRKCGNLVGVISQRVLGHVHPWTLRLQSLKCT